MPSGRYGDFSLLLGTTKTMNVENICSKTMNLIKIAFLRCVKILIISFLVEPFKNWRLHVTL